MTGGQTMEDREEITPEMREWAERYSNELCNDAELDQLVCDFFEIGTKILLKGPEASVPFMLLAIGPKDLDHAKKRPLYAIPLEMTDEIWKHRAKVLCGIGAGLALQRIKVSAFITVHEAAAMYYETEDEAQAAILIREIEGTEAEALQDMPGHQDVLMCCAMTLDGRSAMIVGNVMTDKDGQRIIGERQEYLRLGGPDELLGNGCDSIKGLNLPDSCRIGYLKMVIARTREPN
jgi:hypothetical protein